MIINDSYLYKHSNNFDSIRFIAALLVLIGHSSYILLNKPLCCDPIYFMFGFTIQTLGVIIFFVISGFLVARSWEGRKNIVDFVIARVLRIFPALICVTFLSVFVLGLALTKNNISEYFSSHSTLNYFQNIIMYRIHYFLLGVFENNPIGASINGSLWSLPYEFTCYIFLALLGISSILKNKWIVLGLFIVLVLSYLIFPMKINEIVIPILGIDFKNFFVYFLFFISGVIFYVFRKTIPFSIWGLLICMVFILLIKFNIIPNLFSVFILPYFIFQFAFSRKIKLNHFGKYGDFSYGLYLYAFPVQQTIVYLLPMHIHVWQMILLSFIFVIPFAILSWKYIEKPALNLRKVF